MSTDDTRPPSAHRQPAEQVAPIARQIAELRAELDRLDEAISAVGDLAGRDQCMAMSQAIRVGLDRLADAVAQQAAGL